MKQGVSYQCNRCGARVFSKKAADKHWELTCPKLQTTRPNPNESRKDVSRDDVYSGLRGGGKTNAALMAADTLIEEEMLGATRKENDA